tara:strand:+ start:2050 stop:2304 length:255 start_codon:yes stop_codon:yes gene_type:complete
MTFGVSAAGYAAITAAVAVGTTAYNNKKQKELANEAENDAEKAKRKATAQAGMKTGANNLAKAQSTSGYMGFYKGTGTTLGGGG